MNCTAHVLRICSHFTAKNKNLPKVVVGLQIIMVKNHHRGIFSELRCPFGCATWLNSTANLDMKKHAFLALLVLPALLASGRADTPITIVADEWPPFSGVDLPNGGISLDVISAVLERADYEVETQILPWARIMDGAPRGEYDIIGSLFFDSDIASYMTYGDPFFTTQVKFVRRAGTDFDVNGVPGLEGYSIAVGDGFLYEEEFDRADHLNKVVVTTTGQALQMVAHDRVDLTLDSVEVLNYSMNQITPSIHEQVEVLPFVLAEHDIHMAVRNNLPGRDELVSAFNRALAEMRADGSLDALLSVHLD